MGKKRKRTPKLKGQAPKTVDSPLNNIKLLSVWDADDKENTFVSIADDKRLIDYDEYASPIINLINFVQSSTIEMVNENKDKLDAILINRGKKAPAEFARANNIRYAIENMPSDVLAKSRIEKLIQYNAVTQYGSYVKNPDANKKEPTYSKKITLGACDKQMCRVYLEENATIMLDWKCWDKHLIFVFAVPEYALQKRIVKISLPSVRLVADKNDDNKIIDIIFDFTYEEQCKQKSKLTDKRHIIMGVDLGRVRTFVLAVLNEKGGVIRVYFSRHDVEFLNQKRERINKELGFVYKKIDAYVALGAEDEKHELHAKLVELRRQKGFLKGARTRLGKELAKLSARRIADLADEWGVDHAFFEDLSWVTGAKYGSKWVHGKVFHEANQSLWKMGISVDTVNAKNTSQTCEFCGSHNMYHTGRETVCKDCHKHSNRDRGASIEGGRRGCKKVRAVVNHQRAEEFKRVSRTKSREAAELASVLDHGSFDGDHDSSSFDFGCSLKDGVCRGNGVVSVSAVQPFEHGAHTSAFANSKMSALGTNRLSSIKDDKTPKVKQN